MLPPPITSPSETPDWWRVRISSVNRSTTAGEIPKPCSPASASPLSLTTTRRYFRSAILLAQRVANETAHDDLLARFGGRFRDQLAHGLLALRILYEDLVHQRRFLVELAEFTLDDLVPHLLGLALVLDLLQIDAALALDHDRRDSFRAHRYWIARGDVHRDVARQLLELVVACDEVRLAIELNHNPDFAAQMHVAGD